MKEFLPWRRNFDFKAALYGIEVSPNQFPKAIDASVLTSMMELLYNATNPVFAEGSPERRQAMIESAKGGKILWIDPHSEEEIQKYIDYVNRIEHGERGASIYYDRATESVRRTEVFFGEHKEVGLFRPSGYGEMMVLADMHTQPNNSFFSFTDLQALLGVPTDRSLMSQILSRRRKANTAIVLCPDVQYLAIPSKKTPINIMDLEHISTSLAYLDLEGKWVDNEVLAGMGSEVIDLSKDLVANDYALKFASFQSDMKLRVLYGEISQEDADRAVQDYELYIRHDVEQKLGQMEKQKRQHWKSLDEIQNETGEKALLKYAKDNKFGVYQSTDRAHFTRI